MDDICNYRLDIHPPYIIEGVITHEISVFWLIRCLSGFGIENYYVLCYLMLMLLSPVLNSFIRKYGRKIMPYTLALWMIEALFDWIMDFKCLGFGHGYELSHFVFMYMLGRTAYLYKNEIHKYLTIRKCLLIYFGGAALLTCLHFAVSSKYCFTYTNPLNIIMAFSLFFAFERRNFESKTINWISKSTLAVFVLHVTGPYVNILRDWDRFALKEYGYGTYLILMLITIIGVFIAGILYDKLKDLFMPKIGKMACGWLSSKTRKYALPDD